MANSGRIITIDCVPMVPDVNVFVPMLLHVVHVPVLVVFGQVQPDADGNQARSQQQSGRR